MIVHTRSILPICGSSILVRLIGRHYRKVSNSFRKCVNAFILLTTVLAPLLAGCAIVNDVYPQPVETDRNQHDCVEPSLSATVGEASSAEESDSYRPEADFSSWLAPVISSEPSDGKTLDGYDSNAGRSTQAAEQAGESPNRVRIVPVAPANSVTEPTQRALAVLPAQDSGDTMDGGTDHGDASLPETGQMEQVPTVDSFAPVYPSESVEMLPMPEAADPAMFPHPDE